MLANGDWNNYCNLSVIDRSQGKEFCADFELACTKLEDYVGALSQEIAGRTALIEMLEQSELYYDAQYGEAKIVANVSIQESICYMHLILPLTL